MQFYFFGIFSQDVLVRPVKDLPIISDVKTKIEKAKGWILQDDGAWVSAKNKIPFFQSKINREDLKQYKLGQDNFDVIELREVVIDNNNYAVLVIKYKKGKYDFPLIKEGWSSYKSLDYYVFKPSNLKKILPDTLENNGTNVVFMNVLVSGNIDNYDSKDYKSQMALNIQRYIYSRNPSPSNLIIAVNLIKDEYNKFIRYKFIKTFPFQKVYSMYQRPENQIKLFHKSYYEVKYDYFKKFLSGVLSEEEKNPSSFAGYYQLALFEYEAEDYYEAISDFNEAIERNPNSNFLIYAYRGNAKHKIGDYYGAIEDFSKAIRLKPKEPKLFSIWARAYCNRGVSKYYINDTEGACKDWHKAIEMGANEAYKYINKYCIEY